MTGKQEVLARELAKIPPPTLTAAAATAGYAQVSTAWEARKNPQVQAVIKRGHTERLDNGRDLISKGRSTLSRWSRVLDKVELDPNDPILVVQCMKVGLDWLRAAHELQAAFPPEETSADRLTAYRSTLERGVKIGKYLASRAARQLERVHPPTSIDPPTSGIDGP